MCLEFLAVIRHDRPFDAFEVGAGAKSAPASLRNPSSNESTTWSQSGPSDSQPLRDLSAIVADQSLLLLVGLTGFEPATP